MPNNKYPIYFKDKKILVISVLAAVILTQVSNILTQDIRVHWQNYNYLAKILVPILYVFALTVSLYFNLIGLFWLSDKIKYKF